MRLDFGLNRKLAAVAAAIALLLSACADNVEKSGGDADVLQGSEGQQPDVNQDGEVKIGVMSPGDTNDGGYYEEFVVAAREFTDDRNWDLVVVDHVAPTDAKNQASNLCRQGADMVALGATELRNALEAAEESECDSTVFAIFGEFEELLSPHATQVAGQNFEVNFLAGVAAGELMKLRDASTAGFVAGPELDFVVMAADGFEAGLTSVLPDAKLVVSYTGSFDDGGMAREAVMAQAGQGADVILTYLGGATDAAASAAKESGALAISPGTDRCDEDRFGLSALYAPGLFLANLLAEFENGDVEIGTIKIYEVGVDEYPTVKICDSVEDAAEVQGIVDDVAETIGREGVEAVR